VAGKRTILVTGAAGYIAGQVVPALREAYALRLVDVRDTDRDGRRVEGVVVADLTDPDRDRYRDLVVYGVSDNTRAFWSLESARRVLGYAPEDDAEVAYADDVRRLLTGPDAGVPGGRLGG